MLQLTDKGLYCEAGGFYIDPSRPVDCAVVTHAHSDHARRGARAYYCVDRGVRVLRSRLGARIDARGIPYRQRFRLGDVWVSFHSAGHILGSSQVRLEHERGGEIWVVSGDYKREPDPTCDPFEVVPCDVFVTEATFGTPSYQWARGSDGARELGREISQWWERNASEGVNSVLFAYSLGKAQRVLGELRAHVRRPVLTHETVTRISECYLEEDVALAPFRCLSTLAPGERPREELLVIPPSSFDEELEARFGLHRTAFASGWMGAGKNWSRDRYDTGFVMSDHADWNDLLLTIRQTGARTVYVQHRGNGALVKHLRSLGLEAHPDSALAERVRGSQLTLGI